MIFQQYYLQCLSHASYLVGDETTGRAVVVDPQRDISQYLADATEHGLAIERVIETHFHADFLSGHLELAEACGAAISYGEAAQAEFPIDPLRHGQRLELGDVAIEVRATPGHTPESISVVVWEHPDDPAPYAVLTGDTLFIGDVGRPDLLSSAGLTADELARQLYHSLHEQLLTLPDATRVYPAHGAGSACGKQLSSETVSTIGEQRRMNYALAPMTEDAFVEAITQGQSAAPLYFAFDAAANRRVHDLLDERPPPPLSLDEVLTRQRSGAVVLDTREASEFAAGHLAGSIDVGLSGRFAEYCGDVIGSDQDIVLVAGPGTELEAKVRLGRIGFDRVIGHLAEPLVAFAERPDVVRQGSRLTARELSERLAQVGGLQVLDVRGPGERPEGTIPGAIAIELPTLSRRLDELSREAPIVAYCAGGYRSMIAVSFLEAAGFADCSDLLGGFGAWTGADLPIALPA